MEENITRIKQFGQGTNKLCKLQFIVAIVEIYGSDLIIVWSQPQKSMVATTTLHGHDHNMVVTTNHFNSHCDSILAVWSRPQNIHGCDHAMLCGPTPVLAHFLPIREAYQRERYLGFKGSPFRWKHPSKHVFRRGET